MIELYQGGSRTLQDQFDTRRLADRIEERLVHTRLSEEDRAFIEACDMFLLATADEQGRPNCSYKGGAPPVAGGAFELRAAPRRDAPHPQLEALGLGQ